jgi:flagellar protein FlbD
MIRVTRLKCNDDFILNAELIETIEETPDTVITLTSGKKLIVEETMDEIVRRVMEYRRAIFRNFR